MAANDRKTMAGRIVLLLFASPFALVGLGFLALAVVPNVYDWVRMQSWVPVEAQLISADLKRHDSSKSTTFQVVADYRYTYAGKFYRGNRVGISEKSDNIGDWHERTYARLRNAHPLRVWVNPRDPQETIFDRDLRWAKLGFYMIFVLVFGGAGVGIMWLALRKPLAIPDGVPLWQGNPAWRDNQIRSNAKAGLWMIWVFTGFWNLISSPVIFAVSGEWDKGNHAILIALLFPVIGFGTIVYAVKRTLEWRRFGVTLLQLDPFPGSIGGDVGGSIRVNQLMPRDAIAEVQLSCVYVYSRGSGKDRQTQRNVKWQDQQNVRVEPGSTSSVIKFRFATPNDLPASEIKSMPYYEWTVDISCKLPGPDLERCFVIPVFSADTPRHSMIRPYAVENTANASAVADAIMRVSTTGQGLRLHFPMFRQLGSGIIVTLVGALFVGSAWVFLFGEMKNPPPLMFPIVFGLLGSIAFLGGLYTLGNSLTVVVNAAGIQVTRRIYGLAFNKQIPSATIKSIQVGKGMQATQGTKSTLYYKVQVYARDGKRITVAESITGASAAQQVAKQIESACNIQS